MTTGKNTKRLNDDTFESLTQEERCAVEGITLLMGAPSNQPRATNNHFERVQPRRDSLRHRMIDATNVTPSGGKHVGKKEIEMAWNQHAYQNTIWQNRYYKNPHSVTVPVFTDRYGHQRQFNRVYEHQLLRRNPAPSLGFNRNRMGEGSLNSMGIAEHPRSDIVYRNATSTISEYQTTNKKDPINILKGRLEGLLKMHMDSHEHLGINEKNIMVDFIRGLDDTLTKKHDNKINKASNGSKKENHLKSEHTRRDAINMGIDTLSKLLPFESNKSKMMVIFNAIFHVLELKAKNSRLNKKR